MTVSDHASRDALARELLSMAAEVHDLAAGEGAPEATQTLADLLPELTSGSALYAFGAGLSLALGDYAGALEACARQAVRTQDPAPGAR